MSKLKDGRTSINKSEFTSLISTCPLLKLRRSNVFWTVLVEEKIYKSFNWRSV